MFAKASLVLTLIVSLLFVTQAQPWVLAVEMQHGGLCAGTRCVRGCCTNAACCKLTERQKTPQTPARTSQSTHIQLAALELRARTILFIPPAPRRPFVMLDEPGAAHTLPPLAVSCIRLI